MKQQFGFIKRVDKRLNYHRERFRKLTFRALALCQSEQRNCGMLLVYMGVWRSFAIAGNMMT